uniref:(northern house mosquito) hypothetical protein n=1 Tax=Culex pipiens TaxID=7175 RepID=A0A8D8BLN8_CULPI
MRKLVRCESPSQKSNHLVRNSGGTNASHSSAKYHSSCRTILASTTTGAIRPRGSYSWAITERMLRLVGDRSQTTETTNRNTSASGSQLMPRVLIVSSGSNCNDDCVPRSSLGMSARTASELEHHLRSWNPPFSSSLQRSERSRIASSTVCAPPMKSSTYMCFLMAALAWGNCAPSSSAS